MAASDSESGDDVLCFLEVGEAADLEAVDALLREKFPDRYDGWGRSFTPGSRPHYIFAGQPLSEFAALRARVSMVTRRRLGLEARLLEGGVREVSGTVVDGVCATLGAAAAGGGR